MRGIRKKIKQYIHKIIGEILKVVFAIISSVFKVLMISVFSPGNYRKSAPDGQQPAPRKKRKWYQPNADKIRAFSRAIAMLSPSRKST